MRASDLRLDEKRGILKRLGQTAKSLFSDDEMEERAVGIIADQWESGWRRFMKNAVAGQDTNAKIQYQVQDEKGNWNIYGNIFFKYLIDQGIDEQIAKRIIDKANPGLLKNKEPIAINPKDDKFFNKYVRALMNANALEIKDPKGLLKKVGGAAEQKEKRPELTPQELANEFFGGFVSWAEEAGYAIPESAKHTGNIIVEEMGSNKLTTDVVKKWLRQEHLSQSSGHVVTKFNDLIDNGDISTRDGLAKLFTDIHFGMVRNYLYDAKNKKDRTPEDFNKILNTALDRYGKEDPDLANTIRDTAKQYGPEKAFTDNRKRFETDGLVTTDERTGVIQGGPEFEQAAEEEKLIPNEVRQEAIKLIVGTGSKVEGGEKTEEQAAAMVDAITPEDITPEDAKDEDKVVQTAFKVRAQNREEKPEEGEAEVKDVAVAIVNKKVEQGVDKEDAQVAVTDVVDDDPELTSATDTVNKDEAEEIEAKVDDKLGVEAEPEEKAEPEDEHKRISKIVGDNYFVRERLDPNNQQHMMYYYLADLLGAGKDEEKTEEQEDEK